MRFYRLGDDVYPDTNTVAVEHGRPVVVIDPADREQVERLIRLLPNAQDWLFLTTDDEVDENVADDFRAALRSFAVPTPPRPDEPTGLGAVVEDEDGERWLRWGRANTPGHPWIHDGPRDSCNYSDIAVVRVLSDGVTP